MNSELMLIGFVHNQLVSCWNTFSAIDSGQEHPHSIQITSTCQDDAYWSCNYQWHWLKLLNLTKNSTRYQPLLVHFSWHPRTAPTIAWISDQVPWRASPRSCDARTQVWSEERSSDHWKPPPSTNPDAKIGQKSWRSLSTTIKAYSNLEDPSTIEICQESKKIKTKEIRAINLFNAHLN
jgi:hypothetical protein